MPVFGYRCPPIALTSVGVRKHRELGRELRSPEAVCKVTPLRDEVSEHIFFFLLFFPPLLPAALLVNCSLTPGKVFHSWEDGLGYRIQSLGWEWFI